jgi:hypothetical protein
LNLDFKATWLLKLKSFKALFALTPYDQTSLGWAADLIQALFDHLPLKQITGTKILPSSSSKW